MSLGAADNIIMNLCFLEEPPNFYDELKADLGMDSLKMVELIVELEKEYDILFDEGDLDLDKLVIVGDIYELLDKYIEVY